MTNCVTKDGQTLLYIGISPKKPFSRQDLRKRIIYYYRGNAERSAELRLSEWMTQNAYVLWVEHLSLGWSKLVS